MLKTSWKNAYTVLTNRPIFSSVIHNLSQFQAANTGAMGYGG